MAAVMVIATRRSDEDRNCRILQPPCYKLEIINLLNQPLNIRYINPQQYLQASHQQFGLTLIITWVVTLIWHPEQIYEHPARPIIGSFNPCFGWDYPPASYIALVLCSMNVYLTARYAWLEMTRTRLRNPGKLTWSERFASTSAVVLALSTCFWLLLWVIGPEDNNWVGHTGIFVMYAAGSYLACLGNYLESRYGPFAKAGSVERRHTVFIVVYGFAALHLPTVYFYDLIIYYSRGDMRGGPALPPWVTQSADFIWMGCVMSITSFTPKEELLKQTFELVPDDEAEEAGAALIKP